MAHSASATSSASHEDMVIQCWRREALAMDAPPNMMQKPEVERVTHAHTAEYGRAAMLQPIASALGRQP